jgi:hypothetical protein
MSINNITFFVSVFFLPIWLIWELALLWMRDAAGMHVGTISMIMRERAYQFNVLPFFWSSMAAHWWANWIRHSTYDSPIPAISFWLLVAGTFVLDIVLWKSGIPYQTMSPLAKFLRAPAMQLVFGFIAAYFLFPQRALQGPMRWW